MSKRKGECLSKKEQKLGKKQKNQKEVEKNNSHNLNQNDPSELLHKKFIPKEENVSIHPEKKLHEYDKDVDSNGKRMKSADDRDLTALSRCFLLFIFFLSNHTFLLSAISKIIYFIIHPSSITLEHAFPWGSGGTLHYWSIPLSKKIYPPKIKEITGMSEIVECN